MDVTEIRKLREHLFDMKKRHETLVWEIKASTTKAETLQAEYMRLESLIDKLDPPHA